MSLSAEFPEHAVMASLSPQPHHPFFGGGGWGPETVCQENTEEDDACRRRKTLLLWTTYYLYISCTTISSLTQCIGQCTIINFIS